MTSLCRMREHLEFWQQQVRKRPLYRLPHHQLQVAEEQVALCRERIEQQAAIQIDLARWLTDDEPPANLIEVFAAIRRERDERRAAIQADLAHRKRLKPS